MDMQDKELDAWISAALRPDTSVSAHKKSQIWKQISSQAAQQTILMPTAAEEKVELSERILLMSRAFYAWVTSMMADETQYERARQSHYAFRYGGPSRDGRLVLQFMNPMGFNLLSPSI